MTFSQLITFSHFDIEESIGFGIVKYLVSKKVSDSVSEKFGIKKSIGFGIGKRIGIGKSIGIGIENIW